MPSTGNRKLTAKPTARNFARWRASGVEPRRAVRASDTISAISATPQHAATNIGSASERQKNVSGSAAAATAPSAHRSGTSHGWRRAIPRFSGKRRARCASAFGVSAHVASINVVNRWVVCRSG